MGLGVLVGGGLFFFREPTQENILQSLGLAFIVSGSLYDAFWGIIPNEIAVTGLAAVILLSFLLPDASVVMALVGALLGGGLLFVTGLCVSWLLKKEALGGGDVKLMALIGGVLGWEKIFPVLFWAAVLSLAWVVCLFFIRGGPLRRAVRFGPWMAVATFLSVIFW